MTGETGRVWTKILGREYALKLNANVVSEIEGKLEAPIYDVFEKGISGIRALLWGAIYSSNNRFKIEQAGEMIDGLMEYRDENGEAVEYQRVVGALAKAFSYFFNGGKEPPKEEEKKDANPQTAPSGA
jgi:hypothetical protein